MRVSATSQPTKVQVAPAPTPAPAPAPAHAHAHAHAHAPVMLMLLQDVCIEDTVRLKVVRMQVPPTGRAERLNN